MIPSEKEIREAVDNLLLRTDTHPYDEDVEILLDLSQAYLSVKCPEKISCGAHERTSSCSCICDKIENNEIDYNVAIDDYRLWLTKRLEGLGEVIFNILYSDETDKHLKIDDINSSSFDGVPGYSQVSENIANAIREHLTKE